MKRILLIFCLSLLLLTAAVSPASAMSQLERQAADLINDRREAHGLYPLTISPDLSRKARVKAADLRDSSYFDHDSPTYGSPFQMMRQMDVAYRSAGENIAMGYKSAQAVVSAWMNSPSHRAAILSEVYTHMGVGEAEGYWANWFVRQ